MKTAKISIVASAMVLLFAGCGGGGGGESKTTQKFEETKFDSFGTGVRGTVEFKKGLTNLKEAYTITSIEANQCKGDGTFSPSSFTLSPSEDASKEVKSNLSYSITFKNQGDVNKLGSKDVELANHCITDKVIIKYTKRTFSDDFDSGAKEEKMVILNPSYDQSKVATVANEDPLYKYQWHLKNTGQTTGSITPAVAGNDINVESLWSGENRVTGKGAVVAVIDAGIDMFHPDLKDNIITSLSYNYHTGGTNTTPFRGYLVGTDGESDGGYQDFSHGTSVAGIIAAKAWNGIGTRGVAPDAKLVSYNALELFVDEAKNLFESNKIPFISDNKRLFLARTLDALTRNLDNIDIYSNSWGIASKSLFGQKNENIGQIGKNYDTQLKYGVTHGRSGKGAIYVKAAGNDSMQTAFERMQSNGYFIVVAASKADGNASSYTNFGSDILVNAPAGEGSSTHTKLDEQMIVTTDLSGKQRGYDADIAGQAKVSHFPVTGNENYDYTQRMNGTSAAAPIVSGVVALMLEANPNLTWRDVRYILATTATQNNTDTGWAANAAGHNFNRYYGFGRVNAANAVAAARNFTSLSRMQTLSDRSFTSASTTSGTARGTVSIPEDLKVEYVAVNLELDLNVTLGTTAYTRTAEGNNSTTVLTNTVPLSGTLFEGNNTFTVTNNDVNGTITSISYILNGGTAVEIGTDINTTAPRSIPVSLTQTGTYSVKVDGNSTSWNVSVNTTETKRQADKSSLQIALTSPQGTKSILFSPTNLDSNSTFEEVRLSSVEFLDESSAGTWTLEISDTATSSSFDLKSANLVIRGRE